MATRRPAVVDGEPPVRVHSPLLRTLLRRVASTALLAVAVVGAGALTSCGRALPGAAAPSTSPTSSEAPLGTPPQQVAQPERRVAVVTVEREGDPAGGIAMAVAHDAGPRASYALSALMAARLEAEFPDVEAVPNAGGYRVRAWVPDASRSRRFAEAATAAALTPVHPGDPALVAAARRLENMPTMAAGEPVAAGLAECAGAAVVVSRGASTPPVTTAAGAAQLENWRAGAHGRESVAFAVVGPKATTEAVVGAVAGGPEWPAATPRTAAGSPPNPTTIVTPAATGTIGSPAGSLAPNARTLSLGVWTADPQAARSAAQKLGRAGSPLLERLRVLGQGAGLRQTWRLDRVATSTRRGSACLRFDLTRSGSSAPTPDEIELAARTVRAETEAALASSTASSGVGVGGMDDPRRAAAVAAWNHLGTPGPPALPRVQWLRYQPQPADPVGAMAVALQDAASVRPNAPIQVVSASERGQGDLRILVASPCGTALESGRDAGVGALVMRSLALEHDRKDDVAIAPWASVDGVGLVARSRARAGESVDAQARRSAAALGRLLTAQELGGGSLHQGQAALEKSWGPPTPGYSALLGALAPDHPSWLDARGDQINTAATNRHRAESTRRRWLKGPLRVAVIYSGDDGQPAIVADELRRWIGPWRSGAENICPSAPTIRPERGALRVRASSTDEPVADAYVAVPFASPEGVLPPEARWAVHAMNRPGGWLDQALISPDLASSARAFVLGGHQMGALVVELRAEPDRVDEAVAQVRGLMASLARGAVTPKDALSAAVAVEAEEGRAARDPNSRLLRLWMLPPLPNQPTRHTVTLQSLKSFLAKTFRPRGHVVVVVDGG